MGRFARVTEVDADRVHWVNLDHVRQLVVVKQARGPSMMTRIQIDSGWGEQSLHVTQTPEEILGLQGCADAGRPR